MRCGITGPPNLQKIRHTTKDEIIANILEICLMPKITKTKIVYQAGMNFGSVVPYLSLLTGKGLLEAVPGKHLIYKTTQKGEKALESLRAIEAIIPERLD
ncbi:MAG: winged helix-turn-helix domain-containing protein [Methanothrix sp.]